MAASAGQKLAARLALGITKVDAALTLAAGDDEDGLFYLLDQLDAAELTKLDVLLTAWGEVAIDGAKIIADGANLDPARDRGLILDQLCALVGYGLNLGLYPIGSPYDVDAD